MNVKISQQVNRVSRGFTLIELLIVIGVIAILAVAVLAAIDPVEQLRKADDSRRRADTVEVLKALDRYKTMFAEYPWGSSSVVTRCPQFNGVPATCPLNGPIDVTALITLQEVKPTIADRALEEYFITEHPSTQAFVCFQPTSRAFSNASIAMFDAEGNLCPTCNPRYVCVPE